MTGAMRASRASSTTTPPTAAHAQSLHPRSDENDVQPTPKKLKSEHRPRAQRRQALRDVTNEMVDAKQASASKSTVTEKTTEPSAKQEIESKRGNQELESRDVDEQEEEEEESEGLVCETQQDAEEEEEFESNIEDLVPTPQSPIMFYEAQEPLLVEMPLDAEEDLATIQYRRLRDKQMQNRVLVDYLDDQPQVNAKMRIILIDWLVDVHLRFKLESETLFLAVNYLDRYLTEAMTTRKELQLIGLTSLFIAAKFEEVDALEISDLVYVCDETYTMKEIIETERKILGVLQFNLATASTQSFLSHFTNELHCDRIVTLLAEYFAQNTLIQLPLLLCYLPSESAAASLFLAQCVAGSERPAEEWISQWQITTDCVLDDLLPCIHDLCTVMANPSKKVAALRHKYGTKRFGRVAQKPMDSLEAYLSPV